jgi:hypothetical protein
MTQPCAKHFYPDSRTLRLTWRELETWPRWNCEPTLQSKERDWKPSTYSRRACPRPYRGEHSVILTFPVAAVGTA